MEDDITTYMGNSSAKVVGKDTVQLKFTSSKIVILNDVVHVPDIHKNLISEALLSKHWVKMVLNLINLFCLRMPCLLAKTIL